MTPETQVTTLRLEVELLEELDDEQDERGYSNRTEYIRDILHSRDEIGWGDDDSAADAPDAAPAPADRAVPAEAAPGYNELLDRIDELQRMLQVTLSREAPALEKRVRQGDTSALEVQEDVHPDDIRPYIEAIDSPHIPGRGPVLEKRRDAFEDLYRELYEEGRLRSSELKERCYREDLQYDDDYSWWTNGVLGRFDQLPGIRAPVEGGHYWFYDPEGVRWNREAGDRPGQGFSAKSES